MEDMWFGISKKEMEGLKAIKSQRAVLGGMPGKGGSRIGKKR